MQRHQKASPHTSLSAEDVLNIRAARERGEDVRDVADLYDVAPSTIRKIWRGETFRHVGSPGAGPMGLPPKTSLGDEPTEEEKAKSKAFLSALMAEQNAGDNMLKEIGK